MSQTLLKDFQVVFDRLLEIQGTVFYRTSTGEGQQLIHHPRDPLHLTDDGLKPLLTGSSFVRSMRYSARPK